MKHLRLFIGLLLVGTAAWPALAHAGAWTQQRGHLQSISTLTFSKTSGYFDWRGAAHPQAPYYNQELSHYLEYGLRDDLTLGGKLRFLQIHQNSGTSQNHSSNLGDTSLFLRKRLWQGEKDVWSMQPQLLLPSPDHADDTPKIGSDHPAYGLTLSYGRNFQAFSRKHYTSLNAGGIHRAGPAHDQWILEASAGLSLAEHWTLIPELFLTHSAAPLREGRYSQSSADDYHLSKLQLAVQYEWPEYGKVQLGAFADITGSNAGQSRALLLSYIRDFK